MDIHVKIMVNDPGAKRKQRYPKKKTTGKHNDKHRWKNPHKNKSKQKPIIH